MRRPWISFALLLVLTSTAWAQAPRTLSWQGTLTDGAGVPVPDGDHAVTVRLHKFATGSPVLWTEVHPVVPTVQGGFSIVLGSITPMYPSFDDPYWLSFEVDGGGEMAPRIPLTSAPHAMGLTLPLLASTLDAGAALTVRNAGTGASVLADGKLQAGADYDGVVDVRASGGALRALLQANTGGGGQPSLALLGSGSGASIDLSQTGDASVVLPGNGVSALETLDEPGVTSSILQPQLGITTGVTTTVTSQAITVPAAGWVLAIGYTSLAVSHTFPNDEWYKFAIATSPATIPSDVDVQCEVAAGAQSGLVVLPVTVHRVIPVAAGTTTIYFNALKQTGSASALRDRQMTLLYVPTAYGPVTTSAPAEATLDDPAAVRRAAATFDRERLEQEVAAMRARLESLERTVAAGR